MKLSLRKMMHHTNKKCFSLGIYNVIQLQSGFYWKLKEIAENIFIADPNDIDFDTEFAKEFFGDDIDRTFKIPLSENRFISKIYQDSNPDEIDKSEHLFNEIIDSHLSDMEMAIYDAIEGNELEQVKNLMQSRKDLFLVID